MGYQWKIVTRWILILPRSSTPARKRCFQKAASNESEGPLFVGDSTLLETGKEVFRIIVCSCSERAAESTRHRGRVAVGEDARSGACHHQARDAHNQGRRLPLSYGFPTGGRENQIHPRAIPTLQNHLSENPMQYTTWLLPGISINNLHSSATVGYSPPTKNQH